MISRLCAAIVLTSLLVASSTAQTIRFDTNVGTFDMELNPTGNPNLQGHVDNLMAYIDSGRYERTVINRADEGFVMQMGGFQLDTLTLPATFDDFNDVESFANVIVDADNDGTVDFDVTGLGNERGTVSLALSAGDANSGNSSFFVNVGDNTGALDAQNFVAFANITNMATVDLIMSLPQTDYAGGSLAGDDVPTLNNNVSVFIERAFVIESLADQAAAKRAADDAMMGGMMDEMIMDDVEALAAISGGDAVAAPFTVQAIAVPEPPALVLAVGALMMIYIMKPSRN